MNIPAVSVIMAVYNGERYLAEAMESILAQTFAAFEFIIVDDASTDATPGILAEYARKDARIRVLRNEMNLERSVSRNRAMNEARTELIAMLDADDVSRPERLEKQYAFMVENPDITVCGTHIHCLDSQKIYDSPVDDKDIRVRLLFVSCIAQPSVMFRKHAILDAGGYSPDMPPAEDYDLWNRLSAVAGVRFATIPEPLLLYRGNNTAKNPQASRRQLAVAKKVQKAALARLGLICTDADLERHWLTTGYEPQITSARLRSAKAWLLDILQANKNTGIYDQNVLLMEVLHRHAVLSEYRRNCARNPGPLRSRIKRRVKECIMTLMHG